MVNVIWEVYSAYIFVGQLTRERERVSHCKRIPLSSFVCLSQKALTPRSPIHYVHPTSSYSKSQFFSCLLVTGAAAVFFKAVAYFNCTCCVVVVFSHRTSILRTHDSAHFDTQRTLQRPGSAAAILP